MTRKSKIQDIEALERDYRTSGIADRHLGPKYGVSSSYVGKIAKKRGWKREKRVIHRFGLEPKEPHNPIGATPLYKTAEEMEAAIQAMFETCAAEERPATIAGLALELGFVSRDALYTYEAKNTEFARVIKKARTRIESVVEEKCVRHGTAGQIFWLKNRDNAQWVDKKEQVVTTKKLDDMEGEELAGYIRDLEGELEKISGTRSTKH